jgi:NitT/TauT family transport system permease protein
MDYSVQFQAMSAGDAPLPVDGSDTVAHPAPILPPPSTNARKARSRLRLFALRQEIPSWIYKTLSIATFLAVIGAWAWLSQQPFVNSVFVPTPARVWEALRACLEDGMLWDDIKISALRVTAGFALSALIAIPIGVWLGSFKLIEGIVQPFTEFVRYIPVPALIPVLMLCFGIGETAKIMLIFVGTFFQLTLMVADEIRRVPYELAQVSYTLGATRREIVWLVLFKAALPGIFDALRLCNGWAWTYLMVAELIAANEGLGYRILKFSRFLQTPKIFVYLLVLGSIGLGLDFLFRKLNARLFRWADTTKR